MNGSSEYEIGPEEVELRKAENALLAQKVGLEEKRAELAVQLAQFGLKGTLTGAIGGFLMVIVLAALGVFSPGLGITGTHITIIIGIIGVTVAMYGAFVFNRSASFAARIGEHAFEAGTKNQDNQAGKTSEK